MNNVIITLTDTFEKQTELAFMFSPARFVSICIFNKSVRIFLVIFYAAP